jgi:oligosaccharide repeat unit polymerase
MKMDSVPKSLVIYPGSSSSSVFSSTTLIRFQKIVVLLVTFFVADMYASRGWAILSCVTLLGSFFLGGKCCDLFNVRRITICSFWYLTYLTMILVPAFLVFSDQASPYRDAFLLAVETVLITVPLGWWLVSYFSNFSPVETEVFFLRPVVPLDDTRTFNLMYSLLLGAAIVLTVLYWRSVPSIPLFQLISGSANFLDLALLREDSFKLLESRFVYAFYMVRGLIYPMLIAVAFGLYISHRQAKWLRIFVLVLCLGVFFAALSIAKSPVAAIFLILAFLYYYHRKGVPGRKITAAFFILIFAFPTVIVMGASRGVDITFWDAAAGIGRRLFYIPAETIYFYFEMFPKYTGYLHGRSIGKITALLGGETQDVTQTVSQFAAPTGLETGTANAAFFANWHADFGLFGVLLGGVLTGAVMQGFHIALVRRRKNAITLAVYSFLVFAFWLLQSTSLPIVLMSDGAIPALVLVWFLDGRDWRYRNPGSLAA